MELQFSTSCLPFYHLGHCFATARRVGVDSLELALTPGLLRRGATPALRLMARHDIAVRSLSLGWLGGIPLGDGDIAAVAGFMTALPGCRVVVVPTPAGGVARDFGGYLRSLNALRDALAGCDATITIENAPPGNAGPLDRFPQFRRFVEEWDLGFTYDTSHAAGQGWVITEPLPQLGPRLHNVHLSDFPADARRASADLLPEPERARHAHLPPGAGVLPLRALLRALHHQEYEGLLTLDLSGRALRAWWPPAARAGLAGALNFCRSAISAHRAPPPPRHRLPVASSSEADAESET